MKKKVNRLKIEILKIYPTQGDFAAAIGEHESKVSQVLRGRRKLSQIDGKKWEKKLNTINLLGEYMELPGSAVISLRNDTETSYDMYIQVQNELTRAINELRDDLSVEKFGKKYSELDKAFPDEKKMIFAIRQVYPQRISEAEPNVTQTP